MDTLASQRATQSGQIDAVSESGERLYSHTAPDGREYIRSQLRDLRDRWDSFTDELNAAINRLEACLTEFREFSGDQEQLTRWLKEVESAMLQHTELKATVQEKKAQYQVSKLIHR